MTFLTIVEVAEILYSFKLFLERKTVKDIPESSRLEFLENFSANNFVLSDAEDNTSGPLNREDIADLPLLRTLLIIHQKSREPSFWEVMDSFLLLAYASWSFKNPFATITSLFELYLDSLNQKIYPFGTNEKRDFYELWQQDKLKTMTMNEAWPGIFYEGCIHQFPGFPTGVENMGGGSSKFDGELKSIHGGAC